MTPLGFLNMIVLQWFGVRLGRVVDIDTRKTLGYHWMLGVVPLTGWWTPYRFFGRRKR